MKVDLDQMLALAGDLSHEDARDRFRRFLLSSAKDSDSIRELATQAQMSSDLQHRLALRDLVWSLGIPLGFEPSNSFGGYWNSLSGVIFLLEVVSEDEPLDLTALADRAESLVSILASEPAAGEGTELPQVAEIDGVVDGVEAVDADEADDEDEPSVLCLFVAFDSEILRVEDAIIQEDDEGRFRSISVSALLSLARVVKDYHLIHEDVLLLFLTSGPSVDPLIDLISRVISQCEAETPTLEEIASMLGPIGRGGETTPEEALQDLIDQSQYYAFGNRGLGRRQTKR